MKKTAKAVIVMLLGWQVRRLRRKNRVRIVAIVGSIGKTSTKLAIAKVLMQQYRVRYQDGNYNDLISVPLVFFGREIPSLFNPLSWAKILIANELQIYRNYPYDVVVLELGTDGPGQINDFKKYLSLDLAVLTAITPEHMQFFQDLDEVAKEETSVQSFTKVILANKDLCAPQYLHLKNKSLFTYGTGQADYNLEIEHLDINGAAFTIKHDDKVVVQMSHPSIAKAELYSLCAAAAVGHRFTVSSEKIKAGISKIKSVNGRMSRLDGKNDSIILDDTYNASPAATIAALDTLYSLPSPQKIALLGNMNELGGYSKDAHTQIGEYCNPRQVDLVVTIGPDANKYLAEAAKKRGCTVECFDNPYDAGHFIKENIRSGAIILAKGSQNGVFAEEAVKQFLKNPKDSRLLVRQSPEWMRKKPKSFMLTEKDYKP